MKDKTNFDNLTSEERKKLNQQKIMRQTHSVYVFKEALVRELEQYNRVPLTEENYLKPHPILVQAFRDGRSSLASILTKIISETKEN